MIRRYYYISNRYFYADKFRKITRISRLNFQLKISSTYILLDYKVMLEIVINKYIYFNFQDIHP